MATIYDVAKKAGVSISTVSRVLNNPSVVRDSTRKKVKKAIEELGFVPSADAAARARQHLKRIGVLTPFFTEASFVQRIRGISEQLSEDGFEIIIYTIKNKDQLSEVVDLLSLGNRVDGIISLSILFDNKIRETLKKTGLPLVSVEADAGVFPSVLVDNREGGRLAASYLFSRGYRSFSFIGEYSRMDFTLDSTEQRLEGFLDMLESLGVDRSSVRVALSEFSEHSIDKKVEDFIANHKKGEAVFAASDIIAARILSAARKKGIRVPDEIAVLGFDDLDMAEYMGLSTISQFLDESGKKAAEMIFSALAQNRRDKATTAHKLFLNLSVVERFTT